MLRCTQCYTENARANIQHAVEAATKQSPLAPLLAPSTNQPPFNKPSAFGSAAPSAFGGAKPAFGQSDFTTAAPQPPQQQQQQQQPTSAFGGQTFGQTSQPQSTVIRPGTGAFSNFASGSGAFGAGGFSAFPGQPSAFDLGASAPPASTTATGGAAFGQPSLGGTPSAFSTLAQQPPQAQSAFGTFGQPTNSSVFGAPTAAAAAATTTTTTSTPSVFGPPIQQAQPFPPTTAQPPQQSLPGFSAFSKPTSVFGQPAPQQPPAGFSAFARPNPFASSSTGSAKKPHAGAPNFDAIIEAGLQCLTGAVPGGSRQTTLFKPNSTPYDGNIPPNYSDLVPRDALEAFKSKKFEWGAVPECVPPFELR